MRVAEVDDQRRMAAILAYDAVRMPPRAELQGVVELAARIAGVPKATVNIITDVEQHQIATTGFEGSVCPRRDSMCAVILGAGEPVAVADASRDARFARNPFVTGELDAIRCYVSYPLVSREGVPVGTLLRLRRRSRGSWTPSSWRGWPRWPNGSSTSSRRDCAVASWR